MACRLPKLLLFLPHKLTTQHSSPSVNVGAKAVTADFVNRKIERDYALRAGIVTFCLAEWLFACAILSEQNPFAIYSLVWSPIWAILVACFAAFLGLLVARIANWQRTKPRRPIRDVLEPSVLLASVVCLLTVVLLWELHRQSQVALLRRARIDELQSQQLERLSPRELAAIVENPAADPLLIDRISKLNRTDLNSPLKPWWWPSISNSPTVLSLIARRDNIQEATLMHLVTASVGKHAQRTLDVLIAENPRCLNDCLRALIKKADASDDNLLRSKIALNSKLPLDVARRWAEAGNVIVLDQLGSNLAMPPDLLAMLADHPDALVRLAVAGNAACPDDLLLRLVGDTNSTVSHAASATRIVQKDRHNR